MAELKPGDVVARKSHGMDLLFRVENVWQENRETIVSLKGIDYRIIADAPIEDLVLQSNEELLERGDVQNREVDAIINRILNRELREQAQKKSYYLRAREPDYKTHEKKGRVLHIDGDRDYLEKCIDEYKKFNIEAVGVHVAEREQPNRVKSLLDQIKPDMLVLTGHDGLIKDKDPKILSSYRNSSYFGEAAKIARTYDSDYDNLVIFAGACQSKYDHIISKGANFASSPDRVNIHAYDPVLVSRKVVGTSRGIAINPKDVASVTITGQKGIGGVTTCGKMRDLYPFW